MPTLYVENVPGELYEALRNRAKASRRSMAAEVIALLEQNVPTEKELRARRAFFMRMKKIREQNVEGKFPSTEEMIREDRER